MSKGHNQNGQLSRRQALALTGSLPLTSLIVGSPLWRIGQQIVRGLIYEAESVAYAASKNLRPRKYIAICLPAGPPRWYFDLPLNPYTNGKELKRNPNINTRFAPTSSAEAGPLVYESASFQIGGETVNMPYIWKSDIPTVNQSWVPMSHLLQNMLIIRGIHMATNGHSINRIKMTYPSKATASLGGFVADGWSGELAGTAHPPPLPAINVGFPLDCYRSLKGISPMSVDFNLLQTPLEQLLAPFDGRADIYPKDFISRRQAMDGVIQNALNTLCSYANSQRPGADIICSTQRSAAKLFQKGVGGLAEQYKQLYNKYQSLINQCLDPKRPMLGVTDKVVKRDNYDLRLRSVVDGLNPMNADLRTILVQGQTNMFRLAEGFAIAEYMVTQQLSSSVMLEAGSFTSGLNFEGTHISNWSSDEHFGPAALSLLINSFRARALSACLYELITVLKRSNIFEETVIHIGSEFTRIPDFEGRGSGHGWEGNVISILSGAISKPEVIGNIHLSQKINTTTGIVELGTWGQSAEGTIDGAKAHIGIGHATSTVAQLLRVPHPLNNNGSLAVESQSGKIALTTDKAKNL